MQFFKKTSIFSADYDVYCFQLKKTQNPVSQTAVIDIIIISIE